jgi:hypothetical protein
VNRPADTAAACWVTICSWHKADMLNVLTMSAFWEQTGHLTNRWLLTNLDL